jgi:hypothetical protein
LSAFCSVKPVAACSSTLNEADFQQPESSARFSHVGTLAPASNPRSAASNRHARSGQSLRLPLINIFVCRNQSDSPVLHVSLFVFFF